MFLKEWKKNNKKIPYETFTKFFFSHATSNPIRQVAEEIETWKTKTRLS